MKKNQAKRNSRIEVVLNQDEKELIIKMAKESHMPVSTFVRYKLLKGSV